MTNTAHTPGPWIAEYSDYGEEIWFGGYGAGMWAIEPVGAYLDGASQANARLIAAAPDMLAALEWAVETADTEQYEADWYAAARAAIAKAKGANDHD